MQAMRTPAKSTAPGRDQRQAEAEKTSRLRALRLAKEATEKEEAAREAAAANAAKSARGRGRAALPGDQSKSA
jgi:hypothetical protein